MFDGEQWINPLFSEKKLLYFILKENRAKARYIYLSQKVQNKLN